jgi:hypothetical protein
MTLYQNEPTDTPTVVISPDAKRSLATRMKESFIVARVVNEASRFEARMKAGEEPILSHEQAVTGLSNIFQTQSELLAKHVPK